MENHIISKNTKIYEHDIYYILYNIINYRLIFWGLKIVVDGSLMLFNLKIQQASEREDEDKNL